MSGWEIFPAPGKLNLFLHVVGRRPDGYHLLQTAFRFIARHDDIRIRVREDGLLQRVNEVPGVAAENDLAFCWCGHRWHWVASSGPCGPARRRWPHARTDS